MATEILAAQLGEIRAASAANGGTALSTTAVYIQFPLGTQWVSITPRNLVTAVVVKWLLNPWLRVFKTLDLLATRPTDYSETAQDASTATLVDLSSLNTLAHRDMCLIGSHMPFAGLYVDVIAANANASVSSLDYWSGKEWITAAATDGTASAGVTLAVDGSITWTVPMPWQAMTLADIAPLSGYSLTTEEFPGKHEKLYWMRWTVSAALDTDTTLASVVAINRSTAYSEWMSGQKFEELLATGPLGYGCLQAATDAGTANLIVNVAARREGKLR